MELTPFFERYLDLPNPALYLLLFGAALLENLAPPLPGDAAVAFGGFLAGTGRLSLPWAYLWVTCGSWCGFMGYYLLGRVLGRTRVHRWAGRWASSETLARGEAWVRRYGYWVVLGNRLLAGVRSVISLVAGFSGLGAWRVGVFAAMSSAAWNVLLVGLGYRVGESWEDVLHLLGRSQWAVTGVMGIAVLGWLVVRRVRARRPTGRDNLES